MFTGIITHIGKLSKRTKSFFTFGAPASFLGNVKRGDSVAVNGVCLTVTKKPIRNTFAVELMPETRTKTMLGSLKKDDLVNLELPATPQSFLSGHIVQGHIDGVGEIRKIEKHGNSNLITVRVYPSLARYIVTKGSLAVNGVSLTVIDVTKDTFTVGIIPYTWSNTMFHTLKTGDKVNIEVDIIAKYIYSITRL